MAKPALKRRTLKGKATAQAASARPPRRQADPEARVVALTGVCGFVGEGLLRRLEEDSRAKKIVALDIRKPAFPLDKTTFHRMDLTLPAADGDLAAILAEEGVDTVVHAAFLENPTHATAWAHELEDIGTMHVLNACAEARVAKIVVSSTTLAYGAHPLNPNFLTEEHELKGHARSRFISDKVAAELQVRRFRKENPDVVVTVLRAAPTVSPTVDNFVTRFLGRPVAPVLMGYDPLIQLVHGDDVIDAFQLAVSRDCSGEFNVVGDGVLPYSTLLAMTGKLPFPVPFFLAKPIAKALWATQVFDSPPNLLDFLRYLCVADGRKAREVLGFSPRYDIRAILYDFLGIAERPGELRYEGGR